MRLPASLRPRFDLASGIPGAPRSRKRSVAGVPIGIRAPIVAVPRRAPQAPASKSSGGFRGPALTLDRPTAVAGNPHYRAVAKVAPTIRGVFPTGPITDDERAAQLAALRGGYW